jgi:hypothetical protein
MIPHPPRARKRCGTCKVEKPHTEFYRRGGRGRLRNARVSKCKTCMRETSAAWRKAHPKRYREYQRNYHIFMEKITVTEERGVHKEWKEKAGLIKTPAELAEFARHLSDDFVHDYGTIVHAMAAVMLAAFHVVNNSDQGGITGFQASCLGWKMIRKFMGTGDGPVALRKMEHLAYPQYASEFTSISPETWEWVQKRAQEGLKDGRASEGVLAHWQSIVDGKVPFGLTVKAE